MASELVIPRLQKAIHALEQLLDIISLLDRDDLGALDARRAVPALVNPHRQLVDDAVKSLAAWVESVALPPAAPAPPSGGRISGSDGSNRPEPYTQSWPTRSTHSERAERSERSERDDRREK